jgi:hypothetical protein
MAPGTMRERGTERGIERGIERIEKENENWEMGKIEKRLEKPEIGSDSPFISGGPVEVMSHDMELRKMWSDSWSLEPRVGK